MKPEAIVEDYLIKQAKKNNFLCYKFVSPGNCGVPDRILIGNGQTFFIETKAKNEKPRVLQDRVMGQMKTRGAKVFVADSREQIDEIINLMKEA